MKDSREVGIQVSRPYFCGIYVIENLITKRCYVGGSKDMGRRWSWHLFKLRHDIHPNNLIQQDWNLHGESSFSFRVLVSTTELHLQEQEQQFIEQFNSYEIGYNIKPTSNGFGFRHSEETKQKMRESALYLIEHDPDERKRRSEQAKLQWREGNIGRKIV